MNNAGANPYNLPPCVATFQHEMSSYDQLPPVVRNMLKCANDTIAACEILRAFNEGDMTVQAVVLGIPLLTGFPTTQISVIRSRNPRLRGRRYSLTPWSKS